MLKHLFPVFVAIWFMVHGVLIFRAAAPLPEPMTGRWPWGMFRSAPMHDKRLVVEGRQGNSAWAPISMDVHFQYRRGATDLRYCDHAHAFRRSGSSEERERFAHFLAQQSRRQDVPLSEIRILWQKTHIETKRIRRSSLGRYQVGAQND